MKNNDYFNHFDVIWSFRLKVSADEKFTLSGKVTSISLTDQGGVINVSSKAGRYGKVFLTYNLK